MENTNYFKNPKFIEIGMQNSENTRNNLILKSD